MYIFYCNILVYHILVNQSNFFISSKLLDYETRASEQVPLLIKLKQEHQAMVKAIDSGDTDLSKFAFMNNLKFS